MKFLAVVFILGMTLLLVQITKLQQEKPVNVPIKEEKKALPTNEMSVQEKKARFIALLEPIVQKVHSELMDQYTTVKQDINSKQNTQRIQELKELYKVDDDHGLLLALKPHPQSITLAQAAMESAWATSRFFVEANNIFGMWSFDPNEPRIAANEKREGVKTIWLRKFDSLEDSVREYYKLMGKGSAFQEFRELRYTCDDPFEIITKLDKYSEIGEEYVEEIRSVISYNKFTNYDKK